MSEGTRPALDRHLERVFGDDEPSRVGSGWISGVAGVFLGALSLGGVLVLWFPACWAGPPTGCTSSSATCWSSSSAS